MTLFESEIVFVQTEQIYGAILTECLINNLLVDSLNILVALNFILAIIWVLWINKLRIQLLSWHFEQHGVDLFHGHCLLHRRLLFDPIVIPHSIRLIICFHLICFFESGHGLFIQILEILVSLSVLFLIVLIKLIDCFIAILRSLDIIIIFLLRWKVFHLLKIWRYDVTFKIVFGL